MDFEEFRENLMEDLRDQIYQRTGNDCTVEATNVAKLQNAGYEGIVIRPEESPVGINLDEGGYEIVSGHRRCHASELAGLETIPAIVRNLDDDAATILMVDSNLQRETLLPSERAWAFRMKLEAVKHQGERQDLTSAQVGQKLPWAVNQVADEANSSKTQIQRYIRLTELIPELLDMVDTKQIAFNPGVELSYITPEQQKDFLEAMDYSDNYPGWY